MQVTIESVHLGAVAVIKQESFDDARGFFTEVFREDQFKELGLPSHFVQDNHSGSVKGVTRGLHFQWEPPMAKMMRVTKGEAFLVAVDIRKGSPTLGQWYGRILSDDSRLQVYAPAGFARGFAVLSDYAEIQYKVTGLYNGGAESGIFDNNCNCDFRFIEGCKTNKPGMVTTVRILCRTCFAGCFQSGYSHGISRASGLIDNIVHSFANNFEIIRFDG